MGERRGNVTSGLELYNSVQVVYIYLQYQQKR